MSKSLEDCYVATPDNEIFDYITSINGKVVIGEGELDEAPMLFIGETLGTKKGVEFDDAMSVMSYLDSLSPRAIKATKDLEKMGYSEIEIWGKEAVDEMAQFVKKGKELYKRGEMPGGKKGGYNTYDRMMEGKEKFDEGDLQKIGEKYIDKMKNISSNSDITTDKLPTNFLYVGFIKLILPKSKIIHCYRNSRDNCLSIFKNQFGSKKIKFAYDMKEIVSYYNFYENLMSYWKKILPNFIYDIKYENLISNTKTEIKTMITTLIEGRNNGR